MPGQHRAQIIAERAALLRGQAQEAIGAPGQQAISIVVGHGAAATEQRRSEQKRRRHPQRLARASKRAKARGTILVHRRNPSLHQRDALFVHQVARLQHHDARILMAQAGSGQWTLGATRPYIVCPTPSPAPRPRGLCRPGPVTCGDAQIEPRRIRSARVAVTVGTVRIQVGRTSAALA